MKLLVMFLGVTSAACAGYSYQRSITIDHTKVGSADLVNFTLGISGTYPYLATFGNRGRITQTVACGVNGSVCPADLVFTSDSNCAQPLSWEIESYDLTAGAIVAWVKLPLISHNNDTVIYACYTDNTVATFQGGATCSAWDASSKAIYHLGNTNIMDSGCGAVNLVSTGNPLLTSGPVGPAVSFPSPWQYSGAEAHNLTTVSGAGSGSVTLSAWAMFSGFNAQDGYPVSFVGLFNVTYPFDPLVFGLDALNRALFKVGDESAVSHLSGVSDPLIPGTWYHLTGTWDGSFLSFYVNGTQVSSTATSMSRRDLYVAMNFVDSARYSPVSLDEVRFEGAARSAGWIAAEYLNQSSPSTFYSVGAEITRVNPAQAPRGGSQVIIE